MNIDWSKAPDWATGHGLLAQGAIKQVWYGEKAYMIVGDSRSYAYGGGDGETRHNHTPNAIQLKTLRPALWTGEGLPPVGTELECGFDCEDFKIWHTGICVAVGEDPEGRTDFCVVKCGNKVAMYTEVGRRMRPIRTAEQIAADERKAGIQALLDIFNSNFEGHVLDGLSAIYDANYRKQVAP